MPNPLLQSGRDALTPALAAHGFRPRLLPTIAMLLAVAIFVVAGNWQRARMDAKESLRAQYDMQTVLPPRTLPDLTERDDWTAQRFLPVVVSGEYDAAHQILIDNRIHAGRAGYDVVTPLVL